MNDLAKRTISGALFVAIMAFCITFDRITYFCLFWCIMLYGMREFFNISIGESMKLQRAMAILCGLCGFLAVYFLECYVKASVTLVSVLVSCCFLLLLAIPISCIFRQNHEDHGNLSYVYAALLYIALPIALSPKLVMDCEVFDGWMLLSLFIIIWMSDVGAYAIGTALGQKPDSRKLAPSISPKKSWWGFWGAVVIGTATAVGLHYLTWLPFSLAHCIAVGVIISVGAVCGDLVESMWKRYFHVKDSGNAIPGHGGVLDRFDSSLIAIPLSCIYLSIFGLI